MVVMRRGLMYTLVQLLGTVDVAIPGSHLSNPRQLPNFDKCIAILDCLQFSSVKCSLYSQTVSADIQLANKD